MIILDTNILSALMLRQPDPVIADWLDNQNRDAIWTTAVNAMEIRYGITLMPMSQRSNQLLEKWRRLLDVVLDGRLAVLDQTSGEMAGQLMARRQLEGRSIEWRDAQIAGIALSRDATLATRNTRHFDDAGIQLINPFPPA